MEASLLTGCFPLILGRWWLIHGCQPGVSPQLPAHLQLPGRDGRCVLMSWWPQRRAGRCLFPNGHSDMLMANLSTSKKWHSLTYKMTRQDIFCPFLRVTKRFEWCQRQEHFVRRIICFANIRKIIIILIDRIEWKEHARDFDLLQKSECLLCIMVSFNFYNLWVKAQRGIGICPSSHGWLAMDS